MTSSSKPFSELVKPDWMSDEDWKSTVGDMQSLERIRADAKDHVRRYQATDGRDGYMRGPYPTLLLTTIGRKSGKHVTTPLNFHDLGNDDYVVVGSVAGYPTDPHWALNLKANPQAWLQIKERKWEVAVEQLAGEERERLWPQVVRSMPVWEIAQQRTERKFPLFRLRPK